MSLKRTSLLLLLLMVCATGAEPVRLTPPETRQGQPGQYVTLAYQVEGQGNYQFDVESPQGWTPVVGRRALKLSGRSFVPVTFRVPDLAPVGRTPAIVLRARSEAGEETRSEAHIEVLGRAKISLRSPAAVDGVAGEVLAVPLRVTNQGNQVDTVRLRVINVDQRPTLSRASVELQPGETQEVMVAVQVDRRTSNGYRYLVMVEAVSHNDPKQRQRVQTEGVFGKGRRSDDALDTAPHLVFSANTSLTSTFELTEGQLRGALEYTISPIVSGQLSDFVEASGSFGTFSGSLATPLPKASSLSVRLGAADWSAALGLGLDGVSASGAFRIGEWRFLPRATLRRQDSGVLFGAGLGAETDFGQSKLALGLSTDGVAGAVNQRVDAAGAVYSVALTPEVTLSVSPSVLGLQREDGYTVDVRAREQLVWNTQQFDLTQIYSGGLSGVHTVGVLGGTRALAPFGVRAASIVTFQPQGMVWSNSGVLLLPSLGNLGASLSGGYQHSTVPGQLSAWQLSAAARYGFVIGDFNTSLGGEYTYRSTLPAPSGPSHAAKIDASVTTGPFRIKLGGQWLSSVGEQFERTERLLVTSSGVWALGQRDLIEAIYAFERTDGEPRHSVQGSWEHAWSETVTTQLRYGHSWLFPEQGPPTVTQTIGLTGGISHFLTDGLALTVGYQLSANGGLTGGTYTHSLRFGLSYNLEFALNTPKAVVDLFGGRKGGEVTGNVFQDLDFDGVQSASEPPVSGVVVRAGEVEATSDAKGRYTLRLPSGAHTLTFPRGLPATLEPLVKMSVQVQENSQDVLNVPLAPIDTLEVLVFDDANRDGKLDEGEVPIPYVGIVTGGAASRAGQADASGKARLSGLPAGQYLVKLDPKLMPEGFVQIGEARPVELRQGVRPPLLLIGASLPPRQQVTTFTSGSLAIIGRFEQSVAQVGAQVRLSIQVQGEARSVTVEAFGQTLTPADPQARQTLSFSVPEGTAPGLYDVVVTAKGDRTERKLTLKLLVQ